MPQDLFSRTIPRDDILAGALTTQQFAANLQEVIEGQGPEVYRDAAKFFARSHPSQGMRSLLDEALGRVSGAKGNAPSLIRLETSLGGGKTHSLIALYHAGRLSIPAERVSEFINPAYLPKTPVENIAVFVGDESGATTFPTIEGITPKTLWGYLALRLRGAAGYEHVRPDDEAMTAPGADSLEKTIGDAPTIVMIDEIARYLTVAAGKVVGNSDLAKQSTAFMMSLIRAVEAKPRAVLVITTTEATDVFGEETAGFLTALKGVRELLARKEHVLRPAGDADLAAILARRLFESVEEGAASAAAREYSDALAKAAEAGCAIPEQMTQATWAQEVERSYPFHPSLVAVLDKRVSTMPNFQHTRGALRLLALAIRDLWAAKPPGIQLIHLHDLSLKNSEIVEEVTGHIDRALLEPVITADIASQPGSEAAHAELIDAKRGGHCAVRLATSIYYWSLTREVPGVPEAALLGSVLAPGDNYNLYQRALEDLATSIDDGAWYLTIDPRGGYRFGTEASPIKVLREIEEGIKPNDVARKATEMLESLFRDSTFKIRRYWQGSPVPDNSKDAQLVIFHWDDFAGEKGIDPDEPVPQKIQDVWEKTPAGGIREFRNRLILLAPNKTQHKHMLDAVGKHMALMQLVGSSEHLDRFTNQQQNELEQLAKQSELKAKVALAAHLSLLCVPRKDGLELLQLDPPAEADIRKNQTELILERLKAMEKVLVTGSSAYDPSYLRSKLGNFFDQQQATAALEERLARNADFKIVLDNDSLRTTIQNGIRSGVWEYHDARLQEKGWATKERPNAVVEISSDTFLCPVGSAPKQEVVPCPLCGALHSPGVCPEAGEPSGAKPRVFRKSGSPAHALEQALNDARDAQAEHVESIAFTIDVLDKATAATDLVRLAHIVAPGTNGTAVRYDVLAKVALKDAGDTLTVEFRGGGQDYAALRDPLRTFLAKPDNLSATVFATLKVVFDPPQPLASPTMALIATSASETGPQKCDIVLTTEAKP